MKETPRNQLTMYTTPWCVDCRRAKQFLRKRGVAFREVNIDEEPGAENLVLRVNESRRRVPTYELGGRYFACSPFDPYWLSAELEVLLDA